MQRMALNSGGSGGGSGGRSPLPQRGDQGGSINGATANEGPRQDGK